MKVRLDTKLNKSLDINIGDIFITKKGNPHMLIYNNSKRFQVIKLTGHRQSFVIKCFSTINEIIENYDIAEIIKSSQVTLIKR
jgi:hypothetical protein